MCLYSTVVEHKHQRLLNVARALLFQSNLPLVYWSECIHAVVYLINRTPSLVLDKISPYENLFKKKPDYNFLRTIGCLCYVSTELKDRNKFTPRAEPCVFLGYASGYKGYKLLNLNSNVISICRSVVFHETVFPFKNMTPTLKNDDFFTESILPLSTPAVIDVFLKIRCLLVVFTSSASPIASSVELTASSSEPAASSSTPVASPSTSSSALPFEWGF